MGLDITYMSNCQTIDYNEEDADFFIVRNDPAFIGREAPLPLGKGILVGWDAISFSAWSYGGYNSWRNNLSELFGKTQTQVWEKEDKEYPFYELINFTDCDGVIGSIVSKKLYKEFEEHRDLAKEKLNEADFMLYEQFLTAFEVASDDGAVIFH